MGSFFFRCRFGRNGDWAKAKSLLQNMRDEGVQLNHFSYGTALAAVSLSQYGLDVTMYSRVVLSTLLAERVRC